MIDYDRYVKLTTSECYHVIGFIRGDATRGWKIYILRFTYILGGNAYPNLSSKLAPYPDSSSCHAYQDDVSGCNERPTSNEEQFVSPISQLLSCRADAKI